MKTTRLLALSSAAIALAGCFAEAPKCSDEKTLTLARELFAKQLTELAENLTGLKIDSKQAAEKLRLDLPRASGFDEKIKKYSCEATLSDTDGREMSVSYTSQLNDQGDQLVTVPPLSKTLGSALMDSLLTAPAAKQEAPKATEATPSPPPAAPMSHYEKCIAEADGVMPDMIDCAAAEARSQDARLNASYKAAMSSTVDKEALKAAQRQWIKARDKECAIDNDGGQAAALNHEECVAKKTRQRADELEKIK